MKRFVLSIATLTCLASFFFISHSCGTKQERGKEDYAPYMAKEVLRDEFCNSAEYPSEISDLSISGDSISFSGKVDVYNKGLFTYYSIMKYIGTNVEEEYSAISNWKILSLEVRNDSTTIWKYDSTNKPVLRTRGIWAFDKHLTISGIDFKIADYKANNAYDSHSMDAIRLVTPQELSDEEVKEVIKYSRFRFSPIQFSTDSKAEEYASFDDTYFFRFRQGEFTSPIKAQDYLK